MAKKKDVKVEAPEEMETPVSPVEEAMQAGVEAAQEANEAEGQIEAPKEPEVQPEEKEPEVQEPEVQPEVKEPEKEPEQPKAQTLENEEDMLKALLGSILGCIVEVYPPMNKFKMVKDAWTQRRPGKPYPGYDDALCQLAGEL